MYLLTNFIWIWILFSQIILPLYTNGKFTKYENSLYDKSRIFGLAVYLLLALLTFSFFYYLKWEKAFSGMAIVAGLGACIQCAVLYKFKTTTVLDKILSGYLIAIGYSGFSIVALQKNITKDIEISVSFAFLIFLNLCSLITYIRIKRLPPEAQT